MRIGVTFGGVLFFLAFGAEFVLEARTPRLRVTDGVYCLGRGEWGGLKPLSAPHDSNIFLISGGEELALVDTGTGLGMDQVLTNLWRLGFDKANLKKVFLTSAHFDHSGGLIPLRRALPDIEVFAAGPEAVALREADANYLAYSILPSMPPLEPIHVDHTIQNGEMIQVGDVSVVAHIAPGHTPGATVYLAHVAGQ